MTFDLMAYLLAVFALGACLGSIVALRKRVRSLKAHNEALYRYVESEQKRTRQKPKRKVRR